MLVSMLQYTYCQGVRGSLKIAQALERDMGFGVVSANQQPRQVGDHLPVPGEARVCLGATFCAPPGRGCGCAEPPGW